MLKAQLIGNIGSDARISEFENSKSINFSVAVNESYTDKAGEKKEKTTWVSCTYWRKEGQSCKIAEFLKSGTKVYVEGRPGVHIYQSETMSAAAASFDLKVSEIVLLSAAKTETQAPQPGAASEMQPSRGFETQVAHEDDLPF